MRPQARFALVGEGAERNDLERAAKREGLENVEFYGEHRGPKYQRS